MILKLAFIASCLALAGCASSPDAKAVATCTDLISTGGGMLKYCQTGNRIESSENGIDPNADPAAKVIDDPEVLNGLQKEAGLHPEFIASRKLVARACVAGGADYLSISVKDLKRIITERGAPPLAVESPAERASSIRDRTLGPSPG